MAVCVRTSANADVIPGCWRRITQHALVRSRQVALSPLMHGLPTERMRAATGADV